MDSRALAASEDEDAVAVEEDNVLSALRDVAADVKRLSEAPAAVQLHFAAVNPDLKAFAPVFADLKRRVVAALAASHDVAKRHKAKKQGVVSSLEQERQARSGGFQAAF